MKRLRLTLTIIRFERRGLLTAWRLAGDRLRRRDNDIYLGI